MFNLNGATERIVNMCMEIDGITLADTKYPGDQPEPIPAASMPFIFVEVAEATSTPFTTDILVTTRTWLLLLYVKTFLILDKASEDEAWEAVYPFLISVPKHFATYKRLALNDNGFPGVDNVLLTTDDGPQSESRKLKYDYGALFRLNVTYSEYTKT